MRLDFGARLKLRYAMATGGWRLVWGAAIWLLNVALVTLNILPSTILGGHPQETLSSRIGKLMFVSSPNDETAELLGHSENERLVLALSYDQGRLARAIGRLAWISPLRNHFLAEISLREGRGSSRDRSL